MFINIPLKLEDEEMTSLQFHNEAKIEAFSRRGKVKLVSSSKKGHQSLSNG